MAEQDTLSLSVVVPLFNEESNVEELHAQLTAALRPVGQTYELLFVDDGSKDDTFPRLSEIAGRDAHVRVLRLGRNFGQTAAMSAGFDHARGQVVVTMDGDLQNDPEDIPQVVAKLSEGYDIVSGWRADRKDPFLSRRLPSQLANRLISSVTGVYLHDYGCSLKAYRASVVKNVTLYGEMHRFIPAVASWMGVRVAEMPVNHRPRRKGRSKYGIGRTFRVILDLISVKFLLSYSTRPMQVFGRMGLLSLAGGVFCGFILIAMKLQKGTDMTGNPFMFLTILFLLVGVQFISMGLLGEMNVRIYHESQRKPIYVVREIVGGNGSRMEGTRNEKGA